MRRAGDKTRLAVAALKCHRADRVVSCRVVSLGFLSLRPQSARWQRLILMPVIQGGAGGGS